MLASCSREVDLVFQQSANQRVKSLINTCDSTLKASTTGWRVDYVTPTGYKAIFVMHFSEGDSVTMYMDTNDSIMASRYSFNYSQGAVLSFDTYSLLHSLADPQYGTKGQGNLADFEFILNSVSHDSIVFTGKKNKDRFVLRRAIAGEINKVRLDSRLDARLLLDISFFNAITNGSVSADIVPDYENENQLLIATESGVTKAKINYSDAGFSLSEAVNIGGTQVKDFVWDKATKTFKNADNFRIVASNQPTYSFGVDAAKLLNGNYFSVQDASISVFSWYYYLATKYPNTIDNEIYINDSVSVQTKNIRVAGKDTILVSTDTQKVLLTAYSFLLKDNSGNTTWNNFKAASISYPRADRVKLNLGVREGFYANDLNRDQTIKRIFNLLYDKNGLTVFPIKDMIYLVSCSNSKQWIKIKIKTIDPLQIKFNVVQ
jgi:hypothetical protein